MCTKILIVDSTHFIMLFYFQHTVKDKISSLIIISLDKKKNLIINEEMRLWLKLLTLFWSVFFVFDSHHFIWLGWIIHLTKTVETETNYMESVQIMYYSWLNLPTTWCCLHEEYWLRLLPHLLLLINHWKRGFVRSLVMILVH